MTKAQKDLSKNTFLLIVGLLTIFILGDTENWILKMIQIVGVITAGINVIFIFINFQYFIDDFYPTKTFDEKAKNRSDKLIIAGVNILFFIGAIAMIFEIKKIDNTINGLQFFFICGVIGIFFAIVIMVLIKKVSKTIYYDSTRRYTVLLGLPLAFFMFFPSTLNFVNRHFSNGKTFDKTVLLNHKSTDSKGRAKYLFCQIDNKEERFEVSKTIYESVVEGKPVVLKLQKGYFNYDFVIQFVFVD